MRCLSVADFYAVYYKPTNQPRVGSSFTCVVAASSKRGISMAITLTLVYTVAAVLFVLAIVLVASFGA